MAIVVMQCPHCAANQVAFPVSTGLPMDSAAGFIVLQCPICRWVAVALIFQIPDAKRIKPIGDLTNYGSHLHEMGWRIEKVWPEPPSPVIPESVPAEVERILLQGERNFAIPGNEEAAGIMYRKALDVALRLKDPAAKGSLEKRIDGLVAQGKLTSDLGEWAHQIRTLGNESAHEIDQISREELIALRGFSELLFRYLFSLPAMVKARREAKG